LSTLLKKENVLFLMEEKYLNKDKKIQNLNFQILKLKEELDNKLNETKN
jgi:hypothetical protein